MLSATVITRAEDLRAVRAPWEALLERSALNEPTLSPAWLLAWWDVFGAEGGRQLRAILVWNGKRLVGLAPLLARPRGPLALASPRLELLASGEAEADEICSEFIGVLSERGSEEAVAAELGRALASDREIGPWHELTLTSMRGDDHMALMLREALRKRGLHATLEVASAAPYVPLPARWEDYLAALPSSRRYLISRSLRDFDTWGNGRIRVHRAESQGELIEGRRILVALHEQRWRQQDRPGVFSSSRFNAFHDRVMPVLLDGGALDLVWITVDNAPIMAAYNIVWNNKVYFYQSGRCPDLPAHLRPGITLHAWAIRDAIGKGRREYDFLAGLSRYKLDFALSTRPLVSMRVRRRPVRRLAALCRRALVRMLPR
jgi:CelD/BcsL family acetyltransferase involved in cellulose biosynthesis